MSDNDIVAKDLFTSSLSVRTAFNNQFEYMTAVLWI